MNRITLEEYLKKKHALHSGMTAKSKLIGRLEIYGFVNACVDTDMYYETYAGLYLNGVVNKEPHRQIVLSNYIYQVSSHVAGKDVVEAGIATPVFKSLRLSESAECYNVEDLHIPSLCGNSLYREIKRRCGQGVIINESKMKKAKFPSHITVQDGKAVYNAPEGHVQLLDADGEVKSVGENVMAVCRYVHETTGAMCYALYNLNEVYDDDLD